MAVYMNPSRRLRIKGTKNNENPFNTFITDADTGEVIEFIHHLEITMSARDVNKVNVTYHVAGPNTKVLCDSEGKPVSETVEVEVVEVDVVAIEEIRD